MCDVLLKFDLRVLLLLFEKYTGISATLLTSLMMRLNLFWKLSDTNGIGTNIGVFKRKLNVFNLTGCSETGPLSA